jgi:hypothetical protein
MTRTLAIAALVLCCGVGHAADRRAKTGTKTAVTSAKTLRLPGVSPGLTVPSSGKSAAVSQALADGIARGLSEGFDYKPIKFFKPPETFRPHAGAHFAPVDLEIDGIKYEAFVRNTDTLVGAPPITDIEKGHKVILRNAKTGEYSASFDIKRWQTGQVAGY